MLSTPFFFIALIIFSAHTMMAVASTVGSDSPQPKALERASPAEPGQAHDSLETQPSDFDDESVELHEDKEIIIDSIQTFFSVLSTANKNISHESLLTYEANGFITTYKLQHLVNDNEVKQQLMFMDGPKRQVIRNQSLSPCIQGATRWGLWPTTVSSSSFSAYKLKTISLERIANREAILFEITPKDEYRYGYRYSVDKQTGLVLKAVTYYKDVIIERLQTVSIDFIGKDEELTEGANYSWRVPEVGPCYSKQFTPAWNVQWLPEGFESVGNRITAQGEQVLIFADGLVSVSVFVVNSEAENLSKATARHGATVVVIAPVGSQPDRSIAVVGEIPTATARKIAVSVKPI
ncbi:MAG: sigma-E factor negative regulatory protein RseB [Cellvibrionaceae bacterium]|jgi:sigma-E factor negative regulatory protein RseB